MGLIGILIIFSVLVYWPYFVAGFLLIFFFHRIIRSPKPFTNDVIRIVLGVFVGLILMVGAIYLHLPGLTSGGHRKPTPSYSTDVNKAHVEDLVHAIELRNNQFVKTLIDNKKFSPDLRIDSRLGSPTLLHIAATVNNAEIVQFLLQQPEVDPNFSCSAQCEGTALSVAIDTGSLDAVRVLLADSRVYLDKSDTEVQRGLDSGFSKLPADLAEQVKSRMKEINK